MGTFKITAYYEGDEAKAAVREFKVQKFGETNCIHVVFFLNVMFKKICIKW